MVQLNPLHEDNSDTKTTRRPQGASSYHVVQHLFGWCREFREDIVPDRTTNIKAPWAKGVCLFILLNVQKCHLTVLASNTFLEYHFIFIIKLVYVHEESSRKLETTQYKAMHVKTVLSFEVLYVRTNVCGFVSVR